MDVSDQRLAGDLLDEDSRRIGHPVVHVDHVEFFFARDLRGREAVAVYFGHQILPVTAVDFDRLPANGRVLRLRDRRCGVGRPNAPAKLRQPEAAEDLIFPAGGA